MGIIGKIFKYMYELGKSLVGSKSKVAKSTSGITSLNNSYTALATKIANSNKEVKQFDLFTIWMIAKLIWELVACYLKKKFTTKEALEMLKKPNFLHRLLLKRMIKKVAVENEKRIVGLGSVAGKPAFHDELFKQFIELGKSATVEDLEALQRDFEETGKVLENS